MKIDMLYFLKKLYFSYSSYDISARAVTGTHEDGI